MKLIFSRINYNRKSSFRIRTDIFLKNNHYYVKKTATNNKSWQKLLESAKIFEKNISKNHFSKVLSINYESKSIEYEYIIGTNILKKFELHLLNHEYDQANQLFHQFLKKIESYSIKTNNKIENDFLKWASYDNQNYKTKFYSKFYDLTADNFIIDKKTGDWILIDYEVFFDFYFPLDFVKFRATLYLLSNLQQIIQSISSDNYETTPFLKNIYIPTSWIKYLNKANQNKKMFLALEEKAQNHIHLKKTKLSSLIEYDDSIISYRTAPKISANDLDVGFLNIEFDSFNENYVKSTLKKMYLEKKYLLNENKKLSEIIINIRNSRFFMLWQTLSFLKNFIFSKENMMKKIISKQKIKKTIFYLKNGDFKTLVSKICRILFKKKPQLSNLGHLHYSNYIANNFPNRRTISLQSNEIETFKFKPFFSIIMPTFNSDLNFLKEAIDSVINQSYKHWELCIVDDGSKNDDLEKFLIDISEKDPRVRIEFKSKNEHISLATNTGIKMSKGEFVGFLDHDDILWPNALFEVAKVINENNTVKFIYSDEDKIDENGNHSDPFFKPNWSPYFLRSVNYICHFTVISKEIINEIGYFNPKFNGAQDWDYYLRATYFLQKNTVTHVLDTNKTIKHIPKVLYSWRKTNASTALNSSSKPYAYDIQKNVLEDDLIRRQLKGKVCETDYLGSWSVIPDIIAKPLVSIIIPTKNQYDLIKKCIESIVDKTDYYNYELIIIDTGSTDRKVLDLYKKIANHKIKIYIWNEAFNYSKVCNYGAKISNGEFFLFLNNDVEVISKDWIKKMLSFAQMKDIGAVGVKLLYPNNKIQHIGIRLGIKGSTIERGVAGHILKHYSDGHDYQLYNNYIYCINEKAAVTAACLLIDKRKFNQVGGFEEKLRIAFNDVDLNLKLLKHGYHNLVIPEVKLYHHESVSVGHPESGSRNIKEFNQEINFMIKKWNHLLLNDPFVNANYSLESEDLIL